MMVGSYVALYRFFIVNGQGVFRCTKVFLKALNGHRPAGNARHVIGRGIVVFIRQTVRIGKMSIRKSQRRYLTIHQLRKFRQISAYRLRHCIGTVIGGFHHRPVQGVPQCNNLSRFQRQMGGIPPFPYIAYCLLRDSDLVLRLCICQAQRRCQYLGNAGGILPFIHILLQQHLSGLGVHYHIGVAAGLRHLVLGSGCRNRRHHSYHRRQ